MERWREEYGGGEEGVRLEEEWKEKIMGKKWRGMITVEECVERGRREKVDEGMEERDQ